MEAPLMVGRFDTQSDRGVIVRHVVNKRSVEDILNAIHFTSFRPKHNDLCISFPNAEKRTCGDGGLAIRTTDTVGGVLVAIHL